MAVPEQIPVVNYVADGIVKKFDVPFEYDQQSDLHVYVDGVEPTIDKYYFNGNAFNFYIAPTSGQNVKIKRITPKERDTDYNLHTNTVRPKALNTDFDRLWYVLQEVFSDVGGLSQAVQDEIIARIQGDEDLLNQLTAEISARMLGDESVTEDLKNYVDQVVGAIINDPSFTGIDAKNVNDASGETQQQVNYNGGSKWHSRVGGYKLNERVVLTNGDIVKSTINGNTSNPNSDMTGWVKTNSAGQIFDESGASQQEINDLQKQRNSYEINAHDWGILPTNPPELNSSNWFNLNNAFPDREALDIFVPGGAYSFSLGFFITRPHNIRGVGAGEKSKTIFNFTGSTAVGNSDFKGNIFILHPESASGAFAVSLPVGQVGINGTGAKIDCIKTFGGSEHGIIKNAPSYLNYVCTDSPAKHGILTVADTLNSGGTAVDSSYTAHGGIAGIANQGSNRECTSINHGWGGIVEIGNDANAVANTSCNAAYGGKFGFYDCSLLGGTNIGGQAHENAIADYVQQGSQYDDSGMPQLPSRTVYVGTYAENIRPQGYSINERSLVLGATGVQPYGASQARNALLSSVVGMYTYQAMSVCDDINDVQQGFGGDFVNIQPTELRMGVDGATSHVKLSASGYTDRVKLMVDTFDTMMFFLTNINNTLQKNRPYFPNGLTMGEHHLQYSGASAPISGNWDRGNIVWNENPVNGGKIGWVCTGSGSPGTWKAFGSIDA